MDFFELADCPEPWTKPIGGQNCYLVSDKQMNFYEAEEVRNVFVSKFHIFKFQISTSPMIFLYVMRKFS